MRFDRVAIPLVPRTAANCIDFAISFMRHYLEPIARMWAVVAIPSCALVYVLVDRYEFELPLAMVVFVLATSPLGVLLISGAAPSAFGEPFTFRGTWSRLGWRGIGLLARGLALRAPISLGLMVFFIPGWHLAAGTALFLIVFVVPGWYLAVRTGFFVEQSTLSNLDRHLHDRRADELLKGEIGDLFFRSGAIFLFCAMLWLVLLLTADFLSSHLLGLPLLWGRLGIDSSYLADFDNSFKYTVRFFWGDPVVITAALAVALLVYPIGRLAWFFCYIDARVRRDCWDMELQIVQEAERLEPA
jgi:hypothetical protein